MGREIRRVPPNWDHPKGERPNGQIRYKPMYDRTFAEAAAEWLEDFDRIRAGVDLKSWEADYGGVVAWASDNQAPNPEYYRPWADEDATWFQVWETVSEGTPVSPPFATEDELINYLAANGDFWDQSRCHEPDWRSLWGGVPGVSAWGRARAERFVRAAWAPSMVIAGGNVMDGVTAISQISPETTEHHGN